MAGKERLVFSKAQIYVDGDRLVLLSSNPSELKAGFFPPLQCLVSHFSDEGHDGIFQVIGARVEPVNLSARLSKVNEPGADPPLRMGKEVVLAPEESAFDSAARWKIETADVKSEAVADVLLKITHQGDVARVYAGEKLLCDNFYNGQPWIVGLGGVSPALKDSLELVILPLHSQAPIYLPSGARPAIPAQGQLASLVNIDLIPVYRAVMEGF